MSITLKAMNKQQNYKNSLKLVHKSNAMNARGETTIKGLLTWLMR